MTWCPPKTWRFVRTSLSRKRATKLSIVAYFAIGFLLGLNHLQAMPCSLSRMPEGTKHQGKFSFPPAKGDKASDALFLSPKQGASLAIDLSGGGDCYVGIQVPRPSKVVFKLEDVGHKRTPPLYSATLVVRSFDGKTEKEVIVDAVDSSRPNVYKLYPGVEYLWRLRAQLDARKYEQQKLRPPQRHTPTHKVLIEKLYALPLPNLPMSTGTIANIVFDQYSGDSFFSFDLHYRMSITLEASLPAEVMKAHDERAFDSWWPSFTIMDRKGRKLVPDDSSSNSATGKYYAYITLNPGSYSLEISLEQSHWPREPLGDSLTSAPSRLQVLGSVPAPIPDPLLVATEWLKSTGLVKHFDFVSFYERGRSSDLPDTLKRAYDDILDSVAQERKTMSNGEREGAVNEQYKEPNTTPNQLRQEPPPARDDTPRVLIRLRTSDSREVIEELERRFGEVNSFSLWYRVLQKISFSTGIRSKDIVILMPVYCSGGLIYEVTPGYVGRTGSECKMASARAALDDSPASLMARSSTLAVKRRQFNLEQEARAFLASILPRAKIEYLVTDADYIEAIVRDIRGEVISGGQYWEKLQVAIQLVESNKEPKALRVFVDGNLASTIAGYPPDSQFTKSMEPTYAESLTNYTKKLANNFARYLKEREK